MVVKRPSLCEGSILFIFLASLTVGKYVLDKVSNRIRDEIYAYSPAVIFDISPTSADFVSSFPG